MFPPLPATMPSYSNIHSRVSSLQSVESGKARQFTSINQLPVERLSTPKVPPGFENLQASTHEPNQESSAHKEASVDIGKGKTGPPLVIPVVPQVSVAQNVDLPKSSATITEGGKDDGLREDEMLGKDHAENVDSKIGAEAALPKPITHASSSTKIEQKLEEPLRSPVGLQTTSPQAIPVRDSRVAPTVAGGKAPATYVPSTPETGIKTDENVSGTGKDSSSSVSKSATPDVIEHKRPVTLRLTTEMINKAQKSETAVPASATTERSSTFALQGSNTRGSRQVSVSTSRPSTPAMSDHFTSQDVSRASSPPGNITGTVTSRGRTKNQARKEKRDKGKKEGEANEHTSSAAVAPPTSEPIAPIVARQKKQKKQKPAAIHGSADSPTTQPEPSSKSAENETPVSVAETKVNVSDHQGTGSPDMETATDESTVAQASRQVEKIEKTAQSPRKPYTLRDFYTEALKMQARTGASSVDIQQLLSERVSPMSTLLSEMITDGDLSKDHPWFDPQPFNSTSYKIPPDPRKGQEYLDGNGYSNSDAFGYVYLPQKEKRALFNGHAVSVADSDERKNDLLRRCLITPNGWVMRHLTAAESEKVLDLEERRNLYIEEHGEVGMMAGLGVLEQDDFTNLGGGFDGLARFGDRHGVCWVVGDRENEERESEAAGLENDYGLDELIDDRDMLDEGLSDETDDELGIEMMGAGTMPNTWDTGFPAPDADLSTTTLPPIQGQYGRNVNLRAMDLNALQKRVQEKQKEADGARKDAEKAEKALGKKTKDHTRWRESIYKAVEA